MLVKMKSNGVDTNNTMLWDYFFTSDKKDKLQQTANELKARKFQFVEIYQAKDKSYWLHLERKEIHDANSLYKVDDELYAVAEKYNVVYDGFDVGNENKDKPIDRDTCAVPEQFQTADIRKDGFPLFLTGNTAFDHFPHKHEFSNFIRITTAYKNNGKDMLPDNSEMEDLDTFEYFIEENLTKNKIKNYYVFRETYKGLRNFYIVTNDSEGSAEILKLVRESAKQRDFSFEISSDKTWSAYADFRKQLPKE